MSTIGADLIIAMLWAEAGPKQEHKDLVSGRTFTHRDPVLDWQAGHDYIDSLVWTREAIIDANSSIPYLDFDDDAEGLTDNELLTSVHKILHGKLDEVKSSVENPGRDTDVRLLDDVLLFLSGGMSWGDSPTETAELWWFFSEVEEQLAGVDQILTRVGFFWLGSDDAPFKIVRK